ncbi:hypothetical protein QUF64_12285 [Anaerolineales bacterium HSG6]|nr:hypothetical protein [Anaerolineales bacterium HSG6]
MEDLFNSNGNGNRCQLDNHRPNQGQLRQIRSWQGSIAHTIDQLRELDWLLMAYQRGLLNRTELEQKLSWLLVDGRLLEWSHHVGLTMGETTSSTHQPELVQIVALQQAIYLAGVDCQDVTVLSELREALAGIVGVLRF